MSYPDTSESVKPVYDDGHIVIHQMQPANYQDHVHGKKTRQELHLSLEDAAVLAAKLLVLVGKHTSEYDEL